MEDLSRHLRPRPRHLGLLLAIGGGQLLLVLWLGAQASGAYFAAQAAQSQADALRAARVRRPLAKPSQSELEQGKKWAALRVERSFVWQPVFSALERAASPEIELLEFDPDKPGRQLILSGEAKNEKALVGFLEALATQPLFRTVHLTHQQKKSRDRLETITFELKADMAS